jgi:hypothetical protein
MKTWNLRPLTLSAALLATMTLTAPASAQEPTVPSVVGRAMLRDARGEYLLDDGRTLKVHVGVRGAPGTRARWRLGAPRTPSCSSAPMACAACGCSATSTAPLIASRSKPIGCAET